MTRFIPAKAMGKIAIKDGKVKRVHTYKSVSARLAAKKKKTWKPAK